MTPVSTKLTDTEAAKHFRYMQLGRENLDKERSRRENLLRQKMQKCQGCPYLSASETRCCKPPKYRCERGLNIQR